MICKLCLRVNADLNFELSFRVEISEWEMIKENFTEKLTTRRLSHSQSDADPVMPGRQRRSSSVSASGDGVFVMNHQMKNPSKLLLNQKKILVAINEERGDKI